MREGIQTVMRALDELAKRPADAPIHGLMPAEVEVVFRVQAQRGEENSVDFNVALLEIVEAGTERSTEVTRSEGSTITIRFRNIVFATEEQLIGGQDPRGPDRPRKGATKTRVGGADAVTRQVRSGQTPHSARPGVPSGKGCRRSRVGDSRRFARR